MRARGWKHPLIFLIPRKEGEMTKKEKNIDKGINLGHKTGMLF